MVPSHENPWTSLFILRRFKPNWSDFHLGAATPHRRQQHHWTSKVMYCALKWRSCGCTPLAVLWGPSENSSHTRRPYQSISFNESWLSFMSGNSMNPTLIFGMCEPSNMNGSPPVHQSLQVAKVLWTCFFIHRRFVKFWSSFQLLFGYSFYEGLSPEQDSWIHVIWLLSCLRLVQGQEHHI